MAFAYQAIEYKLYEHLIRIQEMLSVLEFSPALSAQVADCKELVRNKQYRIAVMGEFKRGKSSLINALLGARILPANATPTTATVNRIIYGSEPRACVHFLDGTAQEIPIEALTDYITKLTPEGESRAAQVREAVVEFPTMLCRNHVEIIDTPGLNDDARMTRITIDMVDQVDAVLIPIHARAPFSATERNFVCQLMESQGVGSVFFAVTFLDQLDEDDYEYEPFMAFIRQRIQSEVFAELERRGNPAALEKAHALLDSLSLCGISAAQALESFSTNNRKLRAESRFEEFSDLLLRSVTSRQLENAFQKARDALTQVIDAFPEEHRKRLASFDAEQATLREEEAALRARSAALPERMSAILEARAPRLNGLAASFRQFRDYILKEFIRDLSRLREDTHSAIRNALEQSYARIVPELQRQRAALQQAILTELQDARSELATEPLPCWEGMERFAKTVLSNTLLPLERCLPRSGNLAGQNVIAWVAQGADSSLASYIGELGQAFTAIRSNWISQLSAYGAARCREAEPAFARRQEDLDLRRQAYLQNYQTFSRQAEQILSQCGELAIHE